MAHDSETGEKGAREVTHVWVHQDALVNLEIDGETVTTTSDHPFWNATDAQWQDAGVLDAGDMVLTSESPRGGWLSLIEIGEAIRPRHECN